MLFLIFGIICVHASIGCAVFRNTRYGILLSKDLNFSTFLSSLHVMLHVTLGADWHLLLKDCAVMPPECDPYHGGLHNGDCGSPIGSAVFFLSFLGVVHGLGTNLLVGCLVKGLQSVVLLRSRLGPYPSTRCVQASMSAKCTA